MTDLEASGTCAGDCKRLLQRFNQRIAFAPQMRCIRRIEPAQCGGDNPQLLRRSELAGSIEKSRRKPQRPLLQHLRKQIAFARPSGGSSGRVFIAEDIGAERVVSAEEADVDCGTGCCHGIRIRRKIAPCQRNAVGPVEFFQMLTSLHRADRKRGKPAIAGKFTRNSLRNFPDRFRLR